jgi:hypothetical protein
MSNQGTPPPPADNSGDRIRSYLGAAIVVAGMGLVVLALNAAIGFAEHVSAKDATIIVAIIGTVTSFLGTAIGLFFGVHVAAGGAEQAQKTAKTANETAQTANALVREISTATRMSAVQSMASEQRNRLTSQLAQYRQAHTTALESMRGLAKTASGEAMVALQEAMALASLTPDQIYDQVYDIVVARLPDWYATSEKLMDPRPGAGLSTAQSFKDFCDGCLAAVNARFGKKLVLTGDWRAKHATGSGDAFIFDLAQLVEGTP